MALRYLIVKMSRRVYITILSIAVVIMFSTALFILTDSFRDSNLALLERFKSTHYCVCSTENLYESYVEEEIIEKVNGSACVIAKIKIIKDNVSYETYFLGIDDRIKIINYSGNELWMGLRCPVKPGRLTIVGNNYTLQSNIKKVYQTHVFPNDWIIGNITLARLLRGMQKNGYNFIITEEYIELDRYRCISMTTVIEFFKDGVREMNKNLSLITIIALVVSALLMNSVMTMDMRDNARNIAILKAIGISRYKLFMVFLSRAVYIGGIAAILGFSFGVIISYSFVSIFPRFGIKSLFGIVIYPYLFLYSMMLGIIGAIAGGIPPIISSLRERISKYLGVTL